MNKGKLKEIIILSGISSAETGGAVNILHHVKLTEKLYCYKIYLTESGTFKEKLDLLGIPNIVCSIRSKFDFLGYMKFIWHLLREREIHCFHTHTERICVLFNPILWFLGKKVVTTVHRNISISSIWNSKLLISLFVKLENFSLRYFTHRIIYVSETLRRQLSDYRDINTESSVYKYFPSKPDIGDDKKDNDYPFYEIEKLKEKKHFLIGSIIRATPEKGLDILIEQFVKFKKTNIGSCDVALIVFGESYDNYYTAYGNELSNEDLQIILESILFTGLQNCVHKFFSQIDLYMQPSRSESYGLAVLEASHFNLKITTSNIAVFYETLKDYTGHDVIELNDDSILKYLQKNINSSIPVTKNYDWEIVQHPYVEHDVYSTF